jgi:hypothetical protein
MPDEVESKQGGTVSTSEECSVTVDVGCVLMGNETIDCNEYVSNTPEGCSKQVKFFYPAD